MSRCPNCSYELVLLSHRRKYKCAKCSRLYFQKSIENKTFQLWNLKQRELFSHNLMLENKRPKLTMEERTERRKEKAGLWREKDRELIRVKDRENYFKNRLTINARRRQRWNKNKEEFSALRKGRRNRNLELGRLQARIDYWKHKQKMLADSILKYRLKKAYTNEIAHSVPIFLLCEQLNEP